MATAQSRAMLKEKKRRFQESYDRQPGFFEAVAHDSHTTSFHRGEFFELEKASVPYQAYRALRLMWVGDAFFAQVCYRARMSLKAKGVPVIPRILHKISMITAQMSIDEHVLIEPGVCIAHGQVVIGGVTEIRSGCFIAPWVSIGLKSGSVCGPTVGHRVFVGSGAKLLGEFTVGDEAVIAAQAMVTGDVPAGATVAGVPARVVGAK